MLLIPGSIVTIGSQNLTSRGMAKNREASVLLTDPGCVQQAEKESRLWLHDRETIDLPQIEDMSEHVRRLMRLYRAADKAAAAADEQVKQHRRQRDETARLDEETRHRALRKLRQSIASLRQAAEVVQARVRTTGKDKTSLIASPHHSFTHWRLDDQDVTLKRCYRYLCVNEDLALLGWARVASSRITFVHWRRRRDYAHRLSFGGRSWWLKTEADWSKDAPPACISINMKSWQHEVELYCSFLVHPSRAYGQTCGRMNTIPQEGKDRGRLPVALHCEHALSRLFVPPRLKAAGVFPSLEGASCSGDSPIIDAIRSTRMSLIFRP